jgi:ATP-dependent DNA ligase
MASTSIHIANMLEAINAGDVPGAFDDSRETFMFPKLAYMGSRGATHYWSISVKLLGDDGYVPILDEMLDQPTPDLDGYRAEIKVEAQQKDGKVRDTVPTYVSVGKNLGKKNATNVLTQALRDALGLYNKQKKRADIVEATDAASEPSGAAPSDAKPAVAEFDARPPPQLLKKLGDSRDATLTQVDFDKGITAQRKLNGVRYIVYLDGDRVVRYSRGGDEYPGQDQVVRDIEPMLKSAPPVPPGEYGTPKAPAASDNTAAAKTARAILAAYADPRPYFDGELFRFGESLNKISGQARRGKTSGKNGGPSLLIYNIFDVFFPYAKAAGHEMESRHRQAYIDKFFGAAPNEHPHVARVENFPVKSLKELEELAAQFVKDGYEGGIARKDWAGYRYSYSNYHASNVIKIKPKHDDEFKVVGFEQGRKGKDVGAVIWQCEVDVPLDPKDKLFAVVPNMPLAERKRLFTCLSRQVPSADGKMITRFERDIKGLPLTVEYAERSAKTGKPLQPKAIAFRTYESGPDRDPIKKLLEECAGGNDDDGDADDNGGDANDDDLDE